ncbi:hypothetical protein EB796_008458 [Bugula neritina]|uniref:Uncharacterized protein n=1 Tax=Bugula neritina TaxID=10212 RepID=A0A7J7K3M5_BUGNE|nr:hypothetical protein EB796_008458 [Bugula neritina]
MKLNRTSYLIVSCLAVSVSVAASCDFSDLFRQLHANKFSFRKCSLHIEITCVHALPPHREAAMGFSHLAEQVEQLSYILLYLLLDDNKSQKLLTNYIKTT